MAGSRRGLMTTYYPIGVQYNTTLSFINSYCTPCLYVDYYQATKSTDIIGCRGPYLFVGAIKIGKSVFQLGGFSPVDVIRSTTLLNSPALSNGIYWYFTSGHSFGFADSPTINQNYADSAINPDPFSRLSWLIDSTAGGDRAGTSLHVKSGEFFKVIYNCPEKYQNFRLLSELPSQPTYAPTYVPTNTSSTPTTQPSQKSSGKPTGQPTNKPSGQPTNAQIAQTTMQSTEQPISLPTGRPTMQHTGQPTVRPTGQQTSLPVPTIRRPFVCGFLWT